MSKERLCFTKKEFEDFLFFQKILNESYEDGFDDGFQEGKKEGRKKVNLRN
ncbi:MAG: hypothetical protein ACE5DI_03975 [Candidatus Micrarchaeia archaeon]